VLLYFRNITTLISEQLAKKVKGVIKQ